MLPPPRAMFEKFSEMSIKSIVMAQQEALNYASREVLPEHMFIGLIAAENHSGRSFLGSRIDVPDARRAMESITGARRAPSANRTATSVTFHVLVRDIFAASMKRCDESNLSTIRPEHLYLAILDVPKANQVVQAILKELKANPARLRQEALGRVTSEIQSNEAIANKDKSTVLNTYCRDLCELARQKKIDPLIGRDQEMQRVVEILGRRTKNNPILLGEPGVGKTAIAEGLAHMIVHTPNALPEYLHNKRIMQLDMAGLMAGTKERGELEQRLTNILKEVQQDPNIIIMIDEIHTIVSSITSSTSGDGLNIANIMKPALARGGLRCIGATTLREHRLYIENDAALDRRFQPVKVGEPDADSTLHILKGICEIYERHHNCLYSQEALETAVLLSTRYIPYRQLPDKAIDLMDEAGSLVRSTAHAMMSSAYTAEEKGKADTVCAEFGEILDAKREAVKQEDFDEAVLLYAREMDYRKQYGGNFLPIVDTNHVRQVASLWTNIPLEQVDVDEAQQVLNLADDLHRTVIGQERAIEALTNAMRRAYSGIRNHNRPIACMLFVGPTGVGKTELVKSVASVCFANKLVRLDMSEYMEPHSVSRLVGAPPGYIGYGEGGKLTEAVRRQPSCVVLFDEIEKAHPDIYNILLQILEDGQLTDTTGRTVSFKNALIVLTSNLGSKQVANSLNRSQNGFSMMQKVQQPETRQNEVIEAIVMDAVTQQFAPEIVNRLDDIIVFDRLSRRDIQKIAERMIQDVIRRGEQNGIQVDPPTQEILDRIVQEGYSEEYGAREIRRLVTLFFEDPLVERLLLETARV